MPYLDIPDGRLYYETVGSGEALIFVHGSMGDTRQWDPQFEPFSLAYQVVRYDLRGHGKSTMPTVAPYSHAGDLRALLDQLNIERASFVGESMGGEIIVEFALGSPARLNKLVLVDSTVNGHNWSDEFHQGWSRIADAATSDVNGPFVSALFAHPLLEYTARNQAAKAKLTEIFLDYSRWHFYNTDPLVFVEPPATEQLNRIEAPALVILGLEDAPDLHRIAEILVTGLPNAQRIDLPGVGHVPPLEIPEEFNRILMQFLMQSPNTQKTNTG